MLRRLCAAITVSIFTFTTIFSAPAFAQGPVLKLPPAGSMLTTTPIFYPMQIKGITVYPDNPLAFDFIVETGDQLYSDDELNSEAKRLIKYFLASLTIPEDELWVNLSPYEKDRVIPESFGQTEMGRDLLAQDYILKQLTASLMYPEDELGEKFWHKVRQRVKQQFGDVEIPTNVFSKVWITPDAAKLYKTGNSIYVVSSHLKVLLEEDYVALANSEQRIADSSTQLSADNSLDAKRYPLYAKIIREIIIPAIESEVNNGSTFTQLRQIYNSLILAAWYKTNLRNTLLSQVYVDQNKTKGVNHNTPTINNEIYDQYLKAFKAGVYDYIKEEYDPVKQELIPRKYFSGGFGRVDMAHLASNVIDGDRAAISRADAMNLNANGSALNFTINLNPAETASDSASVTTNQMALKKIFSIGENMFKAIEKGKSEIKYNRYRMTSPMETSSGKNEVYFNNGYFGIKIYRSDDILNIDFIFKEKVFNKDLHKEVFDQVRDYLKEMFEKNPWFAQRYIYMFSSSDFLSLPNEHYSLMKLRLKSEWKRYMLTKRRQKRESRQNSKENLGQNSSFDLAALDIDNKQDDEKPVDFNEIDNSKSLGDISKFVGKVSDNLLSEDDKNQIASAVLLAPRSRHFHLVMQDVMERLTNAIKQNAAENMPYVYQNPPANGEEKGQKYVLTYVLVDGKVKIKIASEGGDLKGAEANNGWRSLMKMLLAMTQTGQNNERQDNAVLARTAALTALALMMISPDVSEAQYKKDKDPYRNTRERYVERRNFRPTEGPRSLKERDYFLLFYDQNTLVKTIANFIRNPRQSNEDRLKRDLLVIWSQNLARLMMKAKRAKGKNQGQYYAEFLDKPVLTGQRANDIRDVLAEISAPDREKNLDSAKKLKELLGKNFLIKSSRLTQMAMNKLVELNLVASVDEQEPLETFGDFLGKLLDQIEGESLFLSEVAEELSDSQEAAEQALGETDEFSLWETTDSAAMSHDNTVLLDSTTIVRFKDIDSQFNQLDDLMGLLRFVPRALLDQRKRTGIQKFLGQIHNTNISKNLHIADKIAAGLRRAVEQHAEKGEVYYYVDAPQVGKSLREEYRVQYLFDEKKVEIKSLSSREVAKGNSWLFMVKMLLAMTYSIEEAQEERKNSLSGLDKTRWEMVHYFAKAFKNDGGQYYDVEDVVRSIDGFHEIGRRKDLRMVLKKLTDVYLLADKLLMSKKRVWKVVNKNDPRWLRLRNGEKFDLYYDAKKMIEENRGDIQSKWELIFAMADVIDGMTEKSPVHLAKIQSDIQRKLSKPVAEDSVRGTLSLFENAHIIKIHKKSGSEVYSRRRGKKQQNRLNALMDKKRFIFVTERSALSDYFNAPLRDILNLDSASLQEHFETIEDEAEKMHGQMQGWINNMASEHKRQYYPEAYTEFATVIKTFWDDDEIVIQLQFVTGGLKSVAQRQLIQTTYKEFVNRLSKNTYFDQFTVETKPPKDVTKGSATIRILQKATVKTNRSQRAVLKWLFKQLDIGKIDQGRQGIAFNPIGIAHKIDGISNDGDVEETINHFELSVGDPKELLSSIKYSIDVAKLWFTVKAAKIIDASDPNYTLFDKFLDDIKPQTPKKKSFAKSPAPARSKKKGGDSFQYIRDSIKRVQRKKLLGDKSDSASFTSLPAVHRLAVVAWMLLQSYKDHKKDIDPLEIIKDIMLNNDQEDGDMVVQKVIGDLDFFVTEGVLNSSMDILEDRRLYSLKSGRGEQLSSFVAKSLDFHIAEILLQSKDDVVDLTTLEGRLQDFPGMRLIMAMGEYDGYFNYLRRHFKMHEVEGHMTESHEVDMWELLPEGKHYFEQHLQNVLGEMFFDSFDPVKALTGFKSDLLKPDDTKELLEVWQDNRPEYFRFRSKKKVLKFFLALIAEHSFFNQEYSMEIHGNIIRFKVIRAKNNDFLGAKFNIVYEDSLRPSRAKTYLSHFEVIEKNEKAYDGQLHILLKALLGVEREVERKADNKRIQDDLEKVVDWEKIDSGKQHVMALAGYIAQASFIPPVDSPQKILVFNEFQVVELMEKHFGKEVSEPYIQNLLADFHAKGVAQKLPKKEGSLNQQWGLEPHVKYLLSQINEGRTDLYELKNSASVDLAAILNRETVAQKILEIEPSIIGKIEFTARQLALKFGDTTDGSELEAILKQLEDERILRVYTMSGSTIKKWTVVDKDNLARIAESGSIEEKRNTLLNKWETLFLMAKIVYRRIQPGQRFNAGFLTAEINAIINNLEAIQKKPIHEKQVRQAADLLEAARMFKKQSTALGDFWIRADEIDNDIDVEYQLHRLSLKHQDELEKRRLQLQEPLEKYFRAGIDAIFHDEGTKADSAMLNNGSAAQTDFKSLNTVLDREDFHIIEEIILNMPSSASAIGVDSPYKQEKSLHFQTKRHDENALFISNDLFAIALDNHEPTFKIFIGYPLSKDKDPNQKEQKQIFNSVAGYLIKEFNSKSGLSKKYNFQKQKYRFDSDPIVLLQLDSSPLLSETVNSTNNKHIKTEIDGIALTLKDLEDWAKANPNKVWRGPKREIEKIFNSSNFVASRVLENNNIKVFGATTPQTQRLYDRLVEEYDIIAQLDRESLKKIAKEMDLQIQTIFDNLKKFKEVLDEGYSLEPIADPIEFVRAKRKNDLFYKQPLNDDWAKNDSPEKAMEGHAANNNSYTINDKWELIFAIAEVVDNIEPEQVFSAYYVYDEINQLLPKQVSGDELNAALDLFGFGSLIKLQNFGDNNRLWMRRTGSLQSDRINSLRVKEKILFAKPNFMKSYFRAESNEIMSQIDLAAMSDPVFLDIAKQLGKIIDGHEKLDFLRGDTERLGSVYAFNQGGEVQLAFNYNEGEPIIEINFVGARREKTRHKYNNGQKRELFDQTQSILFEKLNFFVAAEKYLLNKVPYEGVSGAWRTMFKLNRFGSDKKQQDAATMNDEVATPQSPFASEFLQDEKTRRKVLHAWQRLQVLAKQIQTKINETGIFEEVENLANRLAKNDSELSEDTYQRTVMQIQNDGKEVSEFISQWFKQESMEDYIYLKEGSDLRWKVAYDFIDKWNKILNSIFIDIYFLRFYLQRNDLSQFKETATHLKNDLDEGKDYAYKKMLENILRPTEENIFKDRNGAEQLGEPEEIYQYFLAPAMRAFPEEIKALSKKDTPDSAAMSDGEFREKMGQAYQSAVKILAVLRDATNQLKEELPNTDPKIHKEKIKSYVSGIHHMLIHYLVGARGAFLFYQNTRNINGKITADQYDNLVKYWELFKGQFDQMDRLNVDEKQRKKEATIILNSLELKIENQEDYSLDNYRFMKFLVWGKGWGKYYSWIKDFQSEINDDVEKIDGLLKEVENNFVDLAAMTDVGGIDLNPELLNMDIEYDEAGVPLPAVQQPVINMDIEGFTPVIINVTPIPSLPLMLGLDVDQNDESKPDRQQVAWEYGELGYALRELD